jgi:hypothetical protein
MSGSLHTFSFAEKPAAADVGGNFEIINAAAGAALSAAESLPTSATAFEVTLSGYATQAETIVTASAAFVSGAEATIASLIEAGTTTSTVVQSNQLTSEALAGVTAEITTIGFSVSAVAAQISSFTAEIGQPSGVASVSGGVIPPAQLGLQGSGGISVSGATIALSGTGSAAGQGGADVQLYAGGDTGSSPGEYYFGIRSSHNVASFTHLGTGLYQITFSTPFPDANWVGIYSGGFGGDNSGATPGDTSISDGTVILISEHRGGEIASRTTSSVVLTTGFVEPNGDIYVGDLARISVSIWAAPS